MAATPEKDAISGQSTTGHEWDGIKELNTPLPKWWVYVFYVCIIWAIGYSVVYPSFPVAKDYFAGVFGYNSRVELEKELAKAEAQHGENLAAVKASSVDEIYNDSRLRRYAMAGGAVLFKENCVPCHQSGGAGADGYPTLADDEWLWGGTLEDIQTTLMHGVRWDQDPETRISEMPAYGDFMSEEEITQVATYVKSMAEGKPQEGPGKEIFTSQCAACHSSDGMSAISDGNPMMGAPALANQVWLYSGPGEQMSLEDIKAQIRTPRHGVMPAWGERLDAETDIKMLTVYVHSLGGGQ